MSNQQNHPSGFTFKVLNGSLNGIEFSLGTHAYFICTGDTALGAENAAMSEHTLHIPCATPGHNFIVELGNLISGNEFEVRISYPEHQKSEQLQLNEVCQAGGLVFAIKREGESWSDEVARGIVLAPESDFDDAQIRRAKFSPPTTSRTPVWQILLLLVLVASGAMTGWHFLYVSPVKSDNQVQQIIGDRPGFSLHQGNDKINYLIASTTQQADWANQAMQRKKLGDTWRIVTPQSEETRLTYILESNDVAFYALQFNNPERPTLLLSRNRNKISETNLEQIRQLLLSAMPYASSVNIVLYDDSEVLNRAQQGLRALGFDYQTVKSDSGVTLSSWIPSGDVRLTEFSRFVTQFYQSWGRRYIHFSADISEDARKEKSYKYSQDGYVTMNKSHWMFNKKVDLQ